MNIKAGSLFLVVLDRVDRQTGTTVVASERFQPNSNLGAVEQWTDFRERVRQFLAPLSIEQVALMETRSYANWKYADALARVTKICAVMDVSHMLGVPFATEKTGDVARTLKLQAASLQAFEASKVGLTKSPMYWTTGLSEAAAVAMHVLGDPPNPDDPETATEGEPS